jgi:molybdopterin-guanine dinucleotide biosynthesis protein A
LQDRREKHGDGLLVLASCDLVRPERAWRAPLVAEFDSGQLLHIAAYHAADRWQPFPSVAHTRWLAPLREQVAAGIRSMQAAFDRTKSAAVTWRGASGGPPQANTVEALRAELDPQPSGGSPRF